jgi:hypothetical protein
MMVPWARRNVAKQDAMAKASSPLAGEVRRGVAPIGPSLVRPLSLTLSRKGRGNLCGDVPALVGA